MRSRPFSCAFTLSTPANATQGGVLSSQHVLARIFSKETFLKTHCTWNVRDCVYPDQTTNSCFPEDPDQPKALFCQDGQGRRQGSPWLLSWLPRLFDLLTLCFACFWFRLPQKLRVLNHLKVVSRRHNLKPTTLN